MQKSWYHLREHNKRGSSRPLYKDIKIFYYKTRQTCWLYYKLYWCFSIRSLFRVRTDGSDQRSLHLALTSDLWEVLRVRLWNERTSFTSESFRSRALNPLCSWRGRFCKYNVCFQISVWLLHMFIVEALLMFWSICTRLWVQIGLLESYIITSI